MSLPTLEVADIVTNAQLYFRPDVRLPDPQRCSVDSS
jgi:hypothetical protein